MEAKIFQSGNSQAVRIPKEFRFDVTTVEIFKRGDEVVLKPKTTDLKSLLLSAPKVDFDVERDRFDLVPDRVNFE